MKLTHAQHLFTVCYARLVIWAAGRGYKIVTAEVWRPPEMAAIYAERGKGIKNSLHTKKLAADFLLFTPDGKYITDADEYAEIGRYWKTLHPLARWGGDFKGKVKRDAGHVSFEWNGVK